MAEWGIRCRRLSMCDSDVETSLPSITTVSPHGATRVLAKVLAKVLADVLGFVVAKGENWSNRLLPVSHMQMFCSCTAATG